MSDFSSVLIPGPWTHDFVAANGSRFHVAQAGSTDPKTPLVLFLHTFPQFWWAWRHQLEAVAEAGFRAVAMDLRGVGASDKPPSGYDVPTRTRDAAGVIRSLGAQSAVVVGHGTGGTVAWAMAAMQPAITDAVVAIGAPHPSRLHKTTRSAYSRAAQTRFAFLQMPVVAERALTQRGFTREILQTWSGASFSPEELDTYDNAINVPFAAHNSLEALRWLARSPVRSDGRRFLSAVRKPVIVPALQIHGEDDQLSIPEGADVDAAALTRDYRFETIPGVGHFAPEHAPERVNELLLEFLGRVTSQITSP